MSCYRPLVMYNKGFNSDTNKPIYKYTGLRANRTEMAQREDLGDIVVPCKKCIGCRLDYSRAWADRLVLELDHSKTALFFTLTYNDDNLIPAMIDDNLNCWWYTLDKEHLQLFNKRLRYYFPDKFIRFYAVGEYGSKSLRPHYHGIYFSLSIDDFSDIEFYKYNEFNQPLYISKKLDDIWGKGYCVIGNFSWQSAAYVARYNLKKLVAGSIDALSRNSIPEFSLMSRRPGIGGFFHDDHPEIFDNPRDPIFLSDPNGVVPGSKRIQLPKYNFEKLKLINPELYDSIKQEKIEAANARFFEELSHTDLSEFEYFDLKERLHNKAESLLVRELE